MKIAVLSGKGGTGKTFVSVNLAAASSQAVYLDCDVEEPNGHLFFKPRDVATKEVTVPIPVIDQDKCSRMQGRAVNEVQDQLGCRKCVDFCKFNALAYINHKVKVFDNVCHSCGGCAILCPGNAVSEIGKAIGRIEIGKSGNVEVMTGILNTGEASGVPIIKGLLDEATVNSSLTIIDCPPGSACIVMESIKDADYCILVAEPTIFGVHNLNMIYELVSLFNKPFGAVLNKCTDGINPSEEFCNKNNIPILERIPFTNELASMNSNALIAVREKQEYRELFSDLLKKCEKEELA